MKRIVFIAGFIFLIQFPVQSQDKNDLPGTWYGKISAYPFKQDGNAQCYTKREIPDYKQKLTIDKKLNYFYTAYYRGDTISTQGYALLKNDTLSFIVTHTNQKKLDNSSVSSFFLYILNNSELIYSNFPVKKVERKEETEGAIFQKVETEAEYSLGNDEFLKTIYTSLVSKASRSTDSVRINSYKVKIDLLGNIDLTTLMPLAADPGYSDAIRQGLLSLRSNFKPAMQNGKAVSAYMSFKITY